MATKNSSVCCVPDDVPALTGYLEEDLSLLCKALGHSARVRILNLLIERGTCLSGSLAEEIDLAPSTVSEHLRILKESGLVQGTIDGPRRCYCVNPQTLEYFKNIVKKL